VPILRRDDSRISEKVQALQRVFYLAAKCTRCIAIALWTRVRSTTSRPLMHLMGPITTKRIVRLPPSYFNSSQACGLAFGVSSVGDTSATSVAVPSNCDCTLGRAAFDSDSALRNHTYERNASMRLLRDTKLLSGAYAHMCKQRVRSLRIPAALMVPLVFSSCLTGYTYQPPARLAPVTEVELSASFDETWQAVIDVFAQSQIPIRTIDKSSGLIVADKLRFNLKNFESSYTGPMGSLVTSDYRFADCGNTSAIKYSPTFALFNAQVRSRGEGSTLRVNLIYEWTPPMSSSIYGGTSSEAQKVCVSTGVWEHEVIELITGKLK